MCNRTFNKREEVNLNTRMEADEYNKKMLTALHGLKTSNINWSRKAVQIEVWIFLGSLKKHFKCCTLYEAVQTKYAIPCKASSAIDAHLGSVKSTKHSTNCSPPGCRNQLILQQFQSLLKACQA
jgi:hypothetical protein